jgi:hypothetical protein
MRILIEEVVIQLSEDKANCHLVIRWKGGAATSPGAEAPPASRRPCSHTLERSER